MTRKLILIAAVLVVCSIVGAEAYVVDETITLEPERQSYSLAYPDIVVNSEAVFSDSLLLIAGKDYSLDHKTGDLQILVMPSSAKLRITYLRIPDQYTRAIRLYDRMAYADSIEVLPRPRSADWLSHGSNLNISGSKTFALSFSETGQTDLLQSLYVNLSGDLAPGVSIEAQLSDSQSKLSPEGDSKELSSLDQVFIRVFAKHWELGMGDLDFSFEESRYMQYQTKLEGIAARYDNVHQAQAAFSAGGGKRAQMSIPVIDGKQGPYYLSAGSSQRSFIIVAGTEEIYLDGQRLERGSDYYIDYADGSVMFRRLVSSTNTINAWFQYSDENYSQSTFFTGSKLQLTDRLSLHHHLIHQSDNKDNPLMFSFSPADLDSLAQAGDSQPFSDGVMLTEQGEYRQLTDSLGNIYYEYAPSDSLAIYNIVFSYVGPGRGDYEEFSVKRYRWVGAGNGSWLPVKKLVAPARRSNLELGMLWQTESWQSGIDAMYSFNDQNTLSSLDSEDDSSGVVSFWMAHDSVLSPWFAKVDAEYRFADIYRFGTDGAPEHDFASLAPSDSLAMGNLDLSFAFKGDFWQPSVLLRFRDVQNRYAQRALRFSSNSKAYSVFPAVSVQNTISEQSGEQENSLLQYHNVDLSWAYHILGFKIAGLYSSLEDEDPAVFGSRFLRFQPVFSINTQRQMTALAYLQESTSTKLDSWEQQNSAETYSLKHHSVFEQHSYDLDFSHRRVDNPGADTASKSAYELLSMRSSHNFWDGALNLYNNYELNQTEFFPRIRDLVHVGVGQGVYDSTGVIVDNGEYIYEYITSDKGRLSSEISAMANLYLKPGLIWDDPLFKRIQSDVSISATEQSDDAGDWRTYLFLPDYSYGKQSIYGRQSYLQNFWLDLYKGRIITNLSMDFLRSLDNRYQSSERLYESRQHLQVDFRSFLSMNTRIRLENELSRESRYASEISILGLSSSFERVLSPQNTVQMELMASREKGSRQDGEDDYEIKSLRVSPSIRSILMQKYRVSGSLNMGYNFREGSSYLLFLPQKRAGLNASGTLAAIYRMNSFSSFSLEYRFSKYPEDKSTHNLKLEFKAEL